MMNMKKYMSILILVITLTLVSCDVEPIDNYKGSVIYTKNSWSNDAYSMYIRLLSDSLSSTYKYSFKKIYVLKLDADRYNIGDTIK